MCFDHRHPRRRIFLWFHSFLNEIVNVNKFPMSMSTTAGGDDRASKIHASVYSFCIIYFLKKSIMEIVDSDIRPWSPEDVKEQFGDSLTLLPSNNNIKELQSILRDRLDSFIQLMFASLTLAYKYLAFCSFLSVCSTD